MKNLYLILLAFILTSCNAKQKQQILDTSWVVDKLVINNHNIPKTNDVVLKLESETQFSLQLDANRCGGAMKLSNKKISIDNLMRCTKMCCDSQFSMAVVQALGMVETYTIKDNTFVLKGPNNTRIYFKEFIKLASTNDSPQTPYFIDGDLLVTFNNFITEKEATQFIKQKGLKLDKYLTNRTGLRIALVKVPKGKELFWVTELSKSEYIKTVEVNGVVTINNNNDVVSSTSVSESDNPFINITKTVCYGRCPAYSMKIYKDGTIEYHGNRFVETIGEANFSVHPKKVKYLFDAIDKISFNKFKDEYDGNITDIPSTYIEYKGKKIKLRYHIPKELKNLSQTIHQFAISTGHIHAATKTK